MEILDTLRQLVGNLSTLAYELITLGWHYILLIVWVAWWLCGVNWKRAWTFLGQGAWVPLVLLMIVCALVWSRIAPGSCNCLGFVTVPNFLWQLGYIAMLVAITLLCGWLQGIFHWAPIDIDLEPPSHGHGHAHGHSDDAHAHHHDHDHGGGDPGHGHGHHH